MKFRTTKRDIMGAYNKVISVGYCGLQNLLRYENPVAYTAGTYGWNSDIYEISQTVALSTGYRPFGNVSSSYEIQKKYDTIASGVDCNGLDYKDAKEILKNLLNDFVNEVI